ncbi:MAG: hypothetical protein JJU28_09510 [Cyclobacteriaceae bacterium]|nr:hypothetical protein [Cyclobacteriaceae bacterium]
MRIPTLTRLPTNKRFNLQPRYYDPVKEDIKERTERIRGDLLDKTAKNYKNNIALAYGERRRKEKRLGTMQFLLIVLMMGTFVAWLYYGDIALYVFAVLFPAYIYLRTRRFFD